MNLLPLIPISFLILASSAIAQAPGEDAADPKAVRGQDAVVEQESVEDPKTSPSKKQLREGEAGGPVRDRLRTQENQIEGFFRRVQRTSRNPSPEDLDSLILVAGELKPEWGSTLETLRANDPAEFHKAVSKSRRLWHLVELKKRSPSLFALRMQEMRNGEQLRTLGKAYRDAMEAGQAEEAQQLLASLKELALAHVDLQVRVRGEELAAMSEALEQLRQDMLAELEQRQQLADSLVEQLLKPREQRPASDESRMKPRGLGKQPATPPMPEES